MDRTITEDSDSNFSDLLERDSQEDDAAALRIGDAVRKGAESHKDSANSVVRYVDRARDFAAIRRPDVDLAIWVRSPPSKFTTWLSALTFEQLPDIRILVKPDALIETLGRYLDKCQMPSGDMRDFLIADINDLVNTFADVTGTDAVDMRLERIVHDACWRFHKDRVETRLLVTYLGPGTEWVTMDHAEAAVAEQNHYAGPIESLRAFDVGLFKGSEAEEGGGVVHRSPPIMELGLTRLLLCLNTPSITSPELLA